MDQHTHTPASPVEALAEAFHEFASTFAVTTTIPEAFRMLTHAAIRITSMECGGFFARDENAQALLLSASEGIDATLARRLERLPADDGIGARLAALRGPEAGGGEILGLEAEATARLETVVVIPVQHQGHFIGLLWVGSSRKVALTTDRRLTLEAVALQSGCLIARLRAAGDLRASEVKYRALVRDAGEAILLTDVEGRILEGNAQAENLLGMHAGKVIGRDVRLLHAESKRPTADGYFHRTIATKATVLYDTTFVRDDGSTVPVEILITPIEYGGRQVVKYNVRDVSERKKIDLFKDNIVRNITHKLKGPIAMAQMAYDMLAAASPDDRELRKRSLKIMANSIERMRMDSERILDYYRSLLRQSGAAERPTSLRRMAEQLVEEMRELESDRPISFVVRVEPEADALLVEEADLDVLMGNLLENAVKFTQEGTVTIEGAPEGDRTRIRVTDTGAGIPTDVQGRVFERFYQGNPATPGVGLGLSLCKEIVERYNGAIEIASAGPGKGTVVTAWLPRA